eukprot:scaffold1179_cov118-Isochrysis_galbana.AAC.3
MGDPPSAPLSAAAGGRASAEDGPGPGRATSGEGAGETVEALRASRRLARRSRTVASSRLFSSLKASSRSWSCCRKNSTSSSSTSSRSEVAPLPADQPFEAGWRAGESP